MAGNKAKQFLAVLNIIFQNFFFGKYTLQHTDSRFAKRRNTSETPKFTFTETLKVVETPYWKTLNNVIFFFLTLHFRLAPPSPPLPQSYGDNRKASLGHEKKTLLGGGFTWASGNHVSRSTGTCQENHT